MERSHAQQAISRVRFAGTRALAFLVPACALSWSGSLVAESALPGAVTSEPAAPPPPSSAPGEPASDAASPPSEAPAEAEFEAATDVAPADTRGSTLVASFAQVDRVLRDAADDLDIDIHYQATTSSAPIDEERLSSASSGGYGIAAQLIPEGEGFVLRLCVARPNQSTLVVARAKVDRDTIEVRAIQLLRLAISEGVIVAPSQRVVASPEPADPPRRSSGRALLTAHGALVGGYLGFSLDHIAGSGDARLVYPLMTIGAGAGVGASLVIAEEWDISAQEAWYIWAAGTWSTISGRLIATAAEGATNSNRYGYSLAGTAVGLTLGTVALNTGELSAGGALLTHSGALFGAQFGGIGQMMIRGSTQPRPTLGIGVGMGAGLLIAGAIAPHVESLSSSRVLFVDVSAILGGLAGAALASPILVGEELSPDESRIWLGSIVAGTISGAVVGTLLTTGETAPPMFGVTPWVDLLGPAPGRTGSVPIWGVNGTF